MLDERHRRLELLLHLRRLVRDDLALHPALLLWRRGLDDRCLLHLAVGPVAAHVHLRVLHLALEAELGLLDPGVRAKGLLIEGRGLLGGGQFLPCRSCAASGASTIAVSAHADPD